MPQIAVTHQGWLGLGARYVVRVDGIEVGRLGRKTKEVAVDVPTGEHTVLVDYNGQTSSPQRVDLADGETARFELTFVSAAAAVASSALKPPRNRISDPVGARGETALVALVPLK